MSANSSYQNKDTPALQARSKERTNNKLNPNPPMTPGPGIEPGPHWWEASTLTTAPYRTEILKADVSKANALTKG